MAMLTTNFLISIFTVRIRGDNEQPGLPRHVILRLLPRLHQPVQPAVKLGSFEAVIRELGLSLDQLKPKI